jgi:hypothetical protein
MYRPERCHSDVVPSENSIDEVCCDLLDDLSPRAGGIIWKAPVILKFKARKAYYPR